MAIRPMNIAIAFALLSGCAGQYRQEYEKDVVGATEWNREITQRGASYDSLEECTAALQRDLAAEQRKRESGQPFAQLNNAHCAQVRESRKKVETGGAIAGAVLCVAAGVATGVATGGAVIACP